MAKAFVIKRVETVNYWLDWTREEVIANLAWTTGEGDSDAEKSLTEKFSKLSDEELLEVLIEEIGEYDEMFDYVIDRSEKYGDVQSQDVTVTLEDIDY